MTTSSAPYSRELQRLFSQSVASTLGSHGSRLRAIQHDTSKASARKAQRAHVAQVRAQGGTRSTDMRLRVECEHLRRACSAAADRRSGGILLERQQVRRIQGILIARAEEAHQPKLQASLAR